MGKKVLKRSLALGALMAFVITGNVWAANMTNQTQANEINESTINYVVDGAITASEGDIIVSGNKDVTVLNVNGGDVNWEGDVGIGGYKICENKSVEIKDVKELYVNSGYAGIAVGQDVKTYKGAVYIDETVGKTVIEGNTFGVYAGGNDALVQIESKESSIEGKYGVLTNQGSTINLGTAENKINNLFVKANEKYGIRGSGNSEINIFADNVIVEAVTEGIRPDYGHINIGNADNMAKSISVVSENSDAIAVWASNGSLDIYGAEVSLLTNKQGGNAIYGYANAPVTIVGDDRLEIKGNIRTDRENAIIKINTDVNDALVTIEGDIRNNERGGSIEISLGAEGSYLKGKVTDAKGGVTLNMNKGTIWNVTGDSIVSTITGDGATIRVDNSKDAYVKVNNGDNATNFTLLGGRNVTDQLDVSDPNGSIAKVSSVVDGITFSNYKFEEGSSLGEIDAYQEDGVWKFNERTNVTNSNISDVAALGLMAWRSEMNDMNKRLGELRNANGEHGVWVRMVRGETEYEAVKNQYNTYQLGYDEKLSTDKSWTVGMALTYTDGENNFNGGTGENKHKGFAVYGSKLNDDGSFVDLIAKYARLDHDVEVGTEKGDYSANGYSVSAEYGKRFQQGNGLWIEPQVELTYGKVGSADYMIGKNRAVAHEGMESLVGRIGFSLGKDIKDGNVYARASYLYDFEGETEASYTDAVGNRRYISDDLGGGWWEVGVGANINLSKATYIYADIEKTFGGEVDTNWQWNLGVRYSF